MNFIGSIIILMSSFVTIVYGENVGQDTSNNTINYRKTIPGKTNIEPEDPTRLFLISTGFILPLERYFILTMERTIAPTKTLGILGEIKDMFSPYGVDFFAIYLSLNMYSKKAYKGWWIAPNIGFKKYIDEPIRLTANLNGGYKWELPRGFSIGLSFAPGISGSITRPKNRERINFDFFGGVYFGKAFGKYKK